MTPPAGLPYRLILLGDATDAIQLSAMVTERARARLKIDAIEVTERVPQGESDPARAAGHAVAVVCLGPGGCSEPDREQVRSAMEQGIAVLPVLFSASASALPAELKPINALDWQEDPERVAIAVLRLLGLAEQDRRIFLSYRRTDTLALADQMRHALIDHGFDVFLDRFSVEPAEDFQRRLETELSDKAFTLLLESPQARSSQWVEREVAFSLSNSIGVFALTLPGTAKGKLFPAVPEEMRRRIGRGEMTFGLFPRSRKLRAPALADVLWDIEWRYAERLRRHRQQLVDTLTDWLRQTGHQAVVGPDWTVLAAKGGARSLYLVTPRAPTPSDLLKAHTERERHDAAALAIVAHNPELIDQDLASLNAWVADGRNLETRVHGTLLEWLTSR